MIRPLIAIVAVLATLLAVAESSSAASSEQLSPAAQTLSQCVQTNHELSVLMLIDESGSLRTTDPLNQRVDGVRAALTGLADLADTPVSGRKPQVSVLMAGFYGLVHPDPDTDSDAADAWQPLDGSTVDNLDQEASKYADLNTGRATDYATALLAAHRLLVERAAELTRGGGAPPCQALIWFTDGRYSIPARIGKSGEGLPKVVPYAPNLRLDQKGAGLKAVAAGKSLMCRPSGLMDSIANEGIVRFTVALSTQLSPADAAFLDAATTGSAGGQRCGVDLSQRTGEYLTAQDGDRLFFAFGDLLGSSPPVAEKEVCPRLACLRGTTTFSTVPGLNSFLIRASSGMHGAVLELKGPDGDSVRLRPGGPDRLSLSGTTIIQRWVSSRAVEVEGDFAPGSEWIGPWSYAFIDPSAEADQASSPRSYSSVQLYADLEPSLAGEPAVIRGIPTKITLGLASNAGADPVSDGPLVRRASMTASVSDPVTGTKISVPVVGPSAQGTFTATILVPDSSSASLLYLGLTASLATASGTPVAPQYRSFSLPVRLPPGQGFPILHPSELHLPSLEGTGTATGTITVTGSSVGGGCAWIGTPTIEAPDDAGRITSSSEPRAASATQCLKVDRGQSRQVNIHLTPADQATGTVTASFPVHLRSDVVDGSRVVSIPVTVVLATPPDNTRRAVLLAVLVAIGALLPLALLYVLNRFGARFTAPQRLLVLAQDVELSPAGIEVPVEPAFAAFEPVSSEAAPRGAKSIDIDVVRLQAVAARNLGDLFRGPYGIATARSRGRVFAGGSSLRLRRWKDGSEHEVPLSISGTWVFLPDEFAGGGTSVEAGADSNLWGDDSFDTDEPSKAVSGRLILLISRSGDVNLGRELLADATQVLRETEIGRTGKDDGAGSDEAQSGPARVAAWTRKGRIRRNGDDVDGETESAEPDSETFEVDPWA